MAAEPEPRLQLNKTAVYGSYAGGIFGATLWMLLQPALHQEWLLFGIVALLTGALFIGATRWTLRRPERFRTFFLGTVIALCALTLIVLNVRWEAWVVHDPRATAPAGNLPRAQVNLMVVALYVFLGLIVGLTFRRPR